MGAGGLMINQIEKELRGKFPNIQDYLNLVFKWLYDVEKYDKEQITEAARIKNLPEKSIIYVMLFYQVSEQLKYKSDWKYSICGLPNEEEADKRHLWHFLFDKVKQFNYFPKDEMERWQRNMQPFTELNTYDK